MGQAARVGQFAQEDLVGEGSWPCPGNARKGRLEGAGRAGTCVIVGLVALTACNPVPAPRRVGPAPRSTPNQTPATVRVGHVASTQWAPLYVALDRGYFDEVNVKVRLQAIRPGQDTGDMMARGEVDAVVTDLSARVFNQLARGRTFRIVGSMAAFPG